MIDGGRDTVYLAQKLANLKIQRKRISAHDVRFFQFARLIAKDRHWAT
jgi:hypothetical protein